MLISETEILAAEKTCIKCEAEKVSLDHCGEQTIEDWLKRENVSFSRREGMFWDSFTDREEKRPWH